jgi:hypothetical protein
MGVSIAIDKVQSLYSYRGAEILYNVLMITPINQHEKQQSRYAEWNEVVL